MRFVKPIFILVCIFVAVSCNKKHSLPATAMPEELSLLNGKWKVVSFYHDTGYGFDTSSPPSFNQMEFDAQKVTLRFNNELVRKDKFRFVKEEKISLYALSFAGKEFGALNHYVDVRNDTLHLVNRMFDGGTTYHLVRE